MSDPMQDILASFFVECEELLEAAQDGLAALEAGSADDETINVVFRAVHSIKGGAGAFGLDALVGFAHAFESVLDAVRSGRLDPEPDLVRLFFRGTDTLADLVRAARDGEPADDARVAEIAAEFEARIETPDTGPADGIAFVPMPIALDLDGAVAPPAPPLRRVAIRFRPDPALYAAGNEPLYLLRALEDLGELTTTLVAPDLPTLDGFDPASSLLCWDLVLLTARDDAEIAEVFEFVDGLCALRVTEAPAETESAAPASAPAPTPAAEPEPATSPDDPDDTAAPLAGMRTLPRRPPPATPTVRVDLDRIERLVNLVGELVINQSMLSQSVAVAGLTRDTDIRAGLEEFLQLTRDIQDSVMMIRAQPVKSLFQRMSRIVRESAAATGKAARLVTEGDATEIDKTMIERLSDPLTHMIRNAVDHGLEAPAARAAAGKPEQGTILLTAAHRSGRVVIEVADDGAGIDRARVKAIAEERGLIPRGLSLSEPDIDNLLFLPGFSTAGQVSSLSGRGVGMDVVKTSLAALGGRISIASVPGRGSTFTISLPLTLAVLDGMVVTVAGETLVVPLGAISETLKIRAGDLSRIGPSRMAARVRNGFVPIVDLAERLGYRPRREGFDGSVALLVGRDDGSRAALIVDEIVDQRQVVIKGLDDGCGRAPGVAGAPILGDARIALILDPVELLAAPAPGSVPRALAEAG